MNYLLGHLKANIRMIEEEKYCIDVINQNVGVINAIKKVNNLILSSHLETCVTTAIKGSNTKKRKKVIGELFKIYKEKSWYLA